MSPLEFTHRFVIPSDSFNMAVIFLLQDSRFQPTTDEDILCVGESLSWGGRVLPGVQPGHGGELWVFSLLPCGDNI